MGEDKNKLFGSGIRKYFKRDNKAKEVSPDAPIESPIAQPDVDENAYAVTTGAGAYGVYYNIGNDDATTEREQIKKYRSAAGMSDCDAAINDIVNEAIVTDTINRPINISLENLPYDEDVKIRIREEFNNICRLLDISKYGPDIFRRWYVDGRLYYHVIYHEEDPTMGIKELRYIDPLYLRKVREIKKKTDRATGIVVNEVVREFYVYDDTTSASTGAGVVANGSKVGATSAVPIDEEAIIGVTSGLMNNARTQIISHLHKSVRLVNQLQMLEDALIIYRLSRAPERRIFYIDTGNLPTKKAEEYVRSIMSQYKNKIVYDASTGEIADKRHHMSMVEDFWLPRKEGGRGTEISTLPGGQSLSEIDDVIYFQKKLYKSLNVPMSRLEPDQAFSVGRATEINRDEVKFHKFISRLRKRFGGIFIDALRIQLLMKGVITEEDWDDIQNDITIEYETDNHFSELKALEVLNDRMDALNNMDEVIGKYYSKAWVRRNILHQSDEEIERIDKEIAEESEESDDEMDEFG